MAIIKGAAVQHIFHFIFTTYGVLSGSCLYNFNNYCFTFADIQVANISAHLADLSGDLSERSMQQNSDIRDLTEMLRNLTTKQGNLSPELNLHVPSVCIKVT